MRVNGKELGAYREPFRIVEKKIKNQRVKINEWVSE